jgi:hypothetical protein
LDASHASELLIKVIRFYHGARVSGGGPVNSAVRHLVFSRQMRLSAPGDMRSFSRLVFDQIAPLEQPKIT